MSYLSLITDAYSRKIVGYQVHESLRSEGVEPALFKALCQRSGGEPLIHHSDRGIQYCCDSYQKIHRQHSIQCSMTDGYDCYQNALVERVNGILKTEFLLAQLGDFHQACTLVNESVKIYNPALFTRALIERSEGTGCWHCLSGFASSARVAVE